MEKNSRQRKEEQREVSSIMNKVTMEVAKGRSLGAIEWCRKFRPEMAKELANIEGKVKSLAQSGNVERARGELARFRTHLEAMMKVFKEESGR
jgi:DNA-binding TFAR19-related protein (PDSD5 family)